MVGDRIDTDVAFGRAAGMATFWVESGTTTADEAQRRVAAAGDAHRPDFLAPSIAAIAAALKQ